MSGRLFSQNAFPRAPRPLSSSSTNDEARATGTIQHVAAFRQGEGGITLIHFEACLPLLSRTGWGLKEGAEMLAYPFHQRSDYFLAAKMTLIMAN